MPLDATAFWTAIGAIAGVFAFGIALIAFWLTLGGRMGKTEATAANAEKRASDALTSCTDLHNRMTTETAAMSLFRERVANDYVRREMLGEMEDRIMTAVRDMAQDTKDSIRALGERIDRALQERPAKTR